MNSSHLFYPVLILNKPKINATRVGKQIFFIIAKLSKLFLYWVSKSALRGDKTKFLDFFLHMGIRNKKFGKVKNFCVWVPKDCSRKGEKTQ